MAKVGSTLSVAAAIGSGIGTILGYLYDPNLGNRRRRDVQNRVNLALEEAMATLGTIGSSAREFRDRIADETPIGRFLPARRRPRIDPRLGALVAIVPVALAVGVGMLVAYGMRRGSESDNASGGTDSFSTAYQRTAAPIGG